MKWIFWNIVVLIISLISETSCLAHTQIIYGLKQGRNFSSTHHGMFYLQTGTFLSAYNALQMKHTLQTKTHYPISVLHRGKFKVVRVGPMTSAAAVRKVSIQLNSKTHLKFSPVIVKNSVHKFHPVIHITKSYPIIRTNCQPKIIMLPTPVCQHANWFVSVGSGAFFPHLNSSTSINNGSEFPPPSDQDTYSTQNNTQPLIAVAVGKRWERSSNWLPAYSLGLFYQYNFPTNMGNTVTQYSLPEFTNYNYDWNISSNIILAFAKINLFQYRVISPYLKAGIGGAFNTSSYSESALPDVTARTSPSFASKTISQFAYNAGAGVDFRLSKQFIATIGYEYLNLGKVTTGEGIGTWSTQSLTLNSYHANEVLLSLSYLLDS